MNHLNHQISKFVVGTEIDTMSAAVDSFAYKGISGDCVVTMLTDSTLRATFAGACRRTSDGQIFTMTGGSADIVYVVGNADGYDWRAAAGGSIRVTAGTGSVPDYSWTGGNAVGMQVHHVRETVTPVWAILATSDTDRIAPPLTHGYIPAGTLEHFSGEDAAIRKPLSCDCIQNRRNILFQRIHPVARGNFPHRVMASRFSAHPGGSA